MPLRIFPPSSFVFYAFLFCISFGCQAQIRHSQRVQQDSFLQYLNPKYQNWLAQDVLQDLEKEKKSLNGQHDRAIALTRSLIWDRAEILWKENLKKNPEFLANYLSLSRLYFLLGEKEELEKLHKDLVQNKKIARKKIYRLGERLYRQGRVGESLSLMKKIEKSNVRSNCAPKSSCSIEASLWLGEYYFAEPNYKKAYHYYIRVLNKRPRQGQALWGLGRLSYLAKQWDKAIAYLHLLQKKKELGYKIRKESYYLLANSYFQVGNIPKALAQSKSISKGEHSYASLRLYGDLLLIQNFQTDLGALLELTDSEKLRLSLLRHWYGAEKIEGLKEIHSSFFF